VFEDLRHLIPNMSLHYTVTPASWQTRPELQTHKNSIYNNKSTVTVLDVRLDLVSRELSVKTFGDMK